MDMDNGICISLVMPRVDFLDRKLALLVPEIAGWHSLRANGSIRAIGH